MDNIEKLSSIENYDSLNQPPLRQGSLIHVIYRGLERTGVIFDFKEEYNSWGDFKYGVLLLDNRGLPDHLYWGEYDRNVELLPEQDYNYGWKLIQYYVDRNIFTDKIKSNLPLDSNPLMYECHRNFLYSLSENLMRSITILTEQGYTIEAKEDARDFIETIIENYGGEREYPCLVKILENYKNK